MLAYPQLFSLIIDETYFTPSTYQDPAIGSTDCVYTIFVQWDYKLTAFLCTVRLPLLCHSWRLSISRQKYFLRKTEQDQGRLFLRSSNCFVDTKSADFRFQPFYKTKETVDFHFKKLNKDHLCRGRAWRRGRGRLVEMVGIKI
jgi:hypothetical protein